MLLEKLEERLADPTSPGRAFPPTHIIHGRLDCVCTMSGCGQLFRCLGATATRVVVPDAGHSPFEPGVAKELVAAVERIVDRGSPMADLRDVCVGSAWVLRT